MPPARSSTSWSSSSAAPPTLVPGLAESWDVSPDGMTITFQLRKGVKFGATKGFKPTRDFNADDVLFSFNRQCDDDEPLLQDLAAASTTTSTTWTCRSCVEDIEKIDDYTVVLHAERAERRRSWPTSPWISPRSSRPNIADT